MTRRAVTIPAVTTPAATISVVIPVKDDAIQLDRCLAALAAQTRRADEIVVVDNGSTDDSAAVARDAGAVVVFVRGGGIPAASAAGYDAASGDVIARLDADCIPARGWLELIERQLAAHPRVAAVTGGARFVDGPRLLRAPLALAYLGAYFGSVGLALGHAPLFGSNFAMRRSAWLAVQREVHRGDEFVHDDMDLSMHVGPRRRIRYVRGLGMGISMRPLFDASAFGTRLHRGFHSLAIHWPHELPWLRAFRRLFRA
ncbi:Glycosyl transferase family 2 [Agreia sp. COWG]|nr:Glycosyl transferase family 2 [Agreia sp. COWG]